jgi:hypothetical protein
MEWEESEMGAWLLGCCWPLVCDTFWMMGQLGSFYTAAESGSMEGVVHCRITLPVIRMHVRKRPLAWLRQRDSPDNAKDI